MLRAETAGLDLSAELHRLVALAQLLFQMLQDGQLLAVQVALVA
jgi:hypothetical protein